MNSHRVMVALDNMNKEQCFTFLQQLPAELPIVKIGLELFNRYGVDFVREVHEKYQKDIFLDLKLHDIPNTVAKAMRSLEGLPIKFLTVHLTGGRAMLEACQQVRQEVMPQVNILGVSYLTSLGANDFHEIYGLNEQDIQQRFQALFHLAQDTGTQGVVCSASELELFASDSHLIKVCPGIRFEDEIQSGATDDQKRVLSPQKAFTAGASYLVMGRSLTQAKDLSARIGELNLGS